MNLHALYKALDDFICRVAKKDDPPDWEKLHRIADSMMPQMRDAFLKAVAALQGSIAVRQVEEALASGDAEKAMSAINWPVLATEMSVVQTIITALVGQAGVVAAQSLAVNYGISYSFDLLNPAAVEWIKRHTGDLITQITEESKLAIRAIIQDAFENGGHPYKTARQIRQYIGLTERDARAVLNYWKKLNQEANLSAKQVNDMADTYARKLLRQRAETIARTETINASAEGQRKLWEQASADNMLLGFERTWIVTPDDRLCQRCSAMKGQRAPIGGVYPNGSSGPTLHPRCRCAEGLVEITDKT